MFKRILPVLAVCIALLAAAGCACDSGMATPTPSPTANPTTTPETSPDTAMNPDMSASPDTSPDAGGETSTIPNFQEGTEVQQSDAPEISQALKTQYPDAEIVSIKHAMQDGNQMYAVIVKSGGTEKTIYVSPDGTLKDDGATGSTAG